MVERIETSLQKLEQYKGSGANPLPPTSSIPTEEIRAEQTDLNLKKFLVNTDLPNDLSNEQDLEKQSEVRKKELEKFVESLNEKLYYLNREVQFKVDEKIKRNYISVIDKKTKEIIKEYPPKEVRKFMATMRELERRLNSGDSDLKEIFVNYRV